MRRPRGGPGPGACVKPKWETKVYQSVVYWLGNYPPLSCVHNEAKETGILNSPHCSVLTLRQEARIQTGLSHFYWPVKLMVLDFMGFVFCMCVVVVVCVCSVHHMDISEGVRKCGKFRLYTVTPTVAWPTPPGNSLKFHWRNSLISISPDWGSNLMRERYMCLLKYSNCILGWTV